jgi:hypothetical protein
MYNHHFVYVIVVTSLVIMPISTHEQLECGINKNEKGT